MSDEDAVSAALWDIYRSCSLTKEIKKIMICAYCPCPIMRWDILKTLKYTLAEKILKDTVRKFSQ